MTETTLNQQLQSQLDRLRKGDARARDDLIRLAGERLTVLARKMLAGFPSLRPLEQTEDVFQSGVMRLWRSLEQVNPNSVQEFLGLAALHMRRELIDLIRRHQGRGPAGDRPRVAAGPGEAPVSDCDSTYEPGKLATWTEFHRRVEDLPETERETVNMLWYQGLSQEDAAEVLGVDKSTVKRRWRSARLKLAEWLQGSLPE